MQIMQSILRTLLLIGCFGLFAAEISCASHAVTQSNGTFILQRPHEIVMQLDTQGAFATSRSLPLGDSVKVSISGKPSTLEKLQEGQRIRITRDAATHQVVAIDAL
jgi:hypothetical protein